MKLRRYEQLSAELSRMTCRDLVEIGTWNARRAQELANAALRRNPAVTYQGFDLFELLTAEELEAELSKQPPSKAEVEATLSGFAQAVAGRGRLVSSRRRTFGFALHMGYTRETLPEFRSQHPDFRAQFIFIDGGHKIETIENDWTHCSEFLDRSGALFLDDYYGDLELARSFGCNELIARLRDEPQWDVSILPVVDETAIGDVQIAKVVRATS